MPARTFAILLVGVIAAAGLTVAAFAQSGFGVAGIGIAALFAALAVRLGAR